VGEKGLPSLLALPSLFSSPPDSQNQKGSPWLEVKPYTKRKGGVGEEKAKPGEPTSRFTILGLFPQNRDEALALQEELEGAVIAQPDGETELKKSLLSFLRNEIEARQRELAVSIPDANGKRGNAGNNYTDEGRGGNKTAGGIESQSGDRQSLNIR